MIEINWTLFEKLHACANKYTIRAEELSDNYYANLQVMKEERDAYSHICIAYSKIDEVEFKKEFDDALAHQNRALYDSMDWLSLVIRKSIQKSLRFKTKKIRKSTEAQALLKEVVDISKRIAGYRENKDIISDSTSKADSLTLGIRNYMESINRLEEIYESLLQL